MSLNNLKTKKFIVVFSDGSFLVTKNIILQRIIFFEKDDRNSSLWLKVSQLPSQSNKLSYKHKFLK